MMAAGLKARSEAEVIKSACEADRQELNRKESALADRESRLREKEDHIDLEIKTKAENLIKADRARLEWEYKSRKQYNDRQTESKQEELSRKYKTMTVTYQVEFMTVLIYGLISSILQAITTPVIQEDIVAFFTVLWKSFVGLYFLIERIGRDVAELAFIIENPSASGIVYWVLLIVVMVILIGVILFGFGFALFIYGGYVRENLWDRHTVIAITADIAITLFLAEEIRSILSLNLAALQILIFIVYSLIRMLIVCRHE
ncbi:MAG: hypothetical protein IKZ29_00070 [Clostridiales bacterium]|nr:hypothetical protein [Clostridiales bacterium]